MDSKALSEEETKNVWRQADCVCFDVDSTVCMGEAIDELAEFVDVGQQVKNLTKEAMGGNMTFREALEKRLNIIKPSKKILQDFNQQNKCRLTPGVKELIDILHKKSVDVYLVSGGFQSTIFPVSEILNISKSRVYANKIIFNENGNYEGFCKKQPTSESGGKPRVVSKLKKEFGYKTIVVIGDGMTDLESCPPASAFVGFGGNVIRESVKSKSTWFVTSFQQLIDECTNVN